MHVCNARMQGGYNITTLVDLLDDAELGGLAAKGLSQTILLFDAFFDVEQKAHTVTSTATCTLHILTQGPFTLLAANHTA